MAIGPPVAARRVLLHSIWHANAVKVSGLDRNFTSATRRRRARHAGGVVGLPSERSEKAGIRRGGVPA